MERKKVDTVVVHFDDGTSIYVDNSEVNGDIHYRAGDVNPADVGHKGEGRYKKHEITWCDPPIDTPYGSGL